MTNTTPPLSLQDRVLAIRERVRFSIIETGAAMEALSHRATSANIKRAKAARLEQKGLRRILVRLEREARFAAIDK